VSAVSKTLLILCPGFPKDEADSTCLPFQQLFVKTLHKLRPELQVIVLAFQYPYSSEEYFWNGVKVIPLNGQNKGKLSRLLVWRKALNKIRGIIKANDMTGLLNFWLGECALVGNYAAKRNSIPSFTWLMGQDARKNSRYAGLLKLSASKLIALSDLLAEEFFRNYGIKPVHTIPLGIDTTGKCLNQTRSIDLLGAGSLIPLKQYDLFIRIIAGIVKTKPSVKAVICGEGPERKKLEALIEKYGLGENIKLYGEISHAELLCLMGDSKIFLHPSAYEGFGGVLAEALFAGAHAVSFYRPMHTVFKQHHVVGNEAEMLTLIKAHLNQSNLAHESVITYTIEGVCKNILSLYGS
jgi:glycosyltransferase involved in cell wall biosynthesis